MRCVRYDSNASPRFRAAPPTHAPFAQFFPDAVEITLPPKAIVEELLQLDQCDARGVGPDAAPRLSRVPRALRATLRPFQTDAVEFAIRRDGRVLLADEMGLGKTLQALAISAAFSDDSWPALVLCPTSVREVWVEMLERWIPQLQPRELCVLRRRFDMVCPARVTVASYTMAGLLRDPVLREHRSRPYGMIIVDESHALQYQHNAAKQQTKAYQLVQDLCKPQATRPRPRLLMLSGTPMLRDPDSLYGQLALLRPALFPHYRAFGERYCQTFSHGHWSGSHPQHQAELALYLRACVMMRRGKEEVALLALTCRQ